MYRPRFFKNKENFQIYGYDNIKKAIEKTKDGTYKFRILKFIERNDSFDFAD